MEREGQTDNNNNEAVKREDGFRVRNEISAVLGRAWYLVACSGYQQLSVSKYDSPVLEVSRARLRLLHASGIRFSEYKYNDDHEPIGLYAHGFVYMAFEFVDNVCVCVPPAATGMF